MQSFTEEDNWQGSAGFVRQNNDRIYTIKLQKFFCLIFKKKWNGKSPQWHQGGEDPRVYPFFSISSTWKKEHFVDKMTSIYKCIYKYAYYPALSVKVLKIMVCNNTKMTTQQRLYSIMRSLTNSFIFYQAQCSSVQWNYKGAIRFSLKIKLTFLSNYLFSNSLKLLSLHSLLNIL